MIFFEHWWAAPVVLTVLGCGFLEKEHLPGHYYHEGSWFITGAGLSCWAGSVGIVLGHFL